MSAPAQSRQKVLNRIRAATRSVAHDSAHLAGAYAALPRPYVHRGKLSTEARIDLLIERLREYDAEVGPFLDGAAIPEGEPLHGARATSAEVRGTGASFSNRSRSAAAASIQGT